MLLSTAVAREVIHFGAEISPIVSANKDTHRLLRSSLDTSMQGRHGGWDFKGEEPTSTKIKLREILANTAGGKPRDDPERERRSKMVRRDSHCKDRA